MKRKGTSILRLMLLSLFLLAITLQATRHQLIGGGPDGAPSIHALCPYGGLESLYLWISQGALIDKIYLGTLALFFITLVVALLFRRGFCGWICPFGALQEWMGKLGKKVLGKHYTIPSGADGVLRYLKYGVLILTAVLAWITAGIWVSPYDPWAAYGHLAEGLASLWQEFPVGSILLLVTLIGSFFYDRFFCKYLCPMGAFLGLVSKISPLKIQRDADVCIDCKLCTKSCPVNIPVAELAEVKSAECIQCQECVSSCPKEGALFSHWGSKKVHPMLLGSMVVLLFFAGIGVARAAGVYQLLPGEITEGTVVESAENLKGYMTFGEMAQLMDMSLELLYKKMEIPEGTPSDIPVKEIGDLLPGFDFHEAREKMEE